MGTFPSLRPANPPRGLSLPADFEELSLVTSALLRTSLAVVLVTLVRLLAAVDGGWRAQRSLLRLVCIVAWKPSLSPPPPLATLPTPLLLRLLPRATNAPPCEDPTVDQLDLLDGSCCADVSLPAPVAPAPAHASGRAAIIATRRNGRRRGEEVAGAPWLAVGSRTPTVPSAMVRPARVRLKSLLELSSLPLSLSVEDETGPSEGRGLGAVPPDDDSSPFSPLSQLAPLTPLEPLTPLAPLAPLAPQSPLARLSPLAPLVPSLMIESSSIEPSHEVPQLQGAEGFFT